jgi:hypothetical protein
MKTIQGGDNTTLVCDDEDNVIAVFYDINEVNSYDNAMRYCDLLDGEDPSVAMAVFAIKQFLNTQDMSLIHAALAALGE